MAEAHESAYPSLPIQAPPGLATGRPEPPKVSRSVEQLLDLQRIGITMSPDAARPEEAWGVLNPASARSRDGELFLFPRVVATGNYSRIGMARVIYDAAGNPAGVERLGLVLEPRESYEYVSSSVGGVEDPRISFIPLLDVYVMSYTAYGPQGARVALAVSTDLFTWDRLGLMQFDALDGFSLDACDNKDCVIFPVPVTDPAGRPAFALLHRPRYPAQTAPGSPWWRLPPGVTDPRPSIWISYVPVVRARHDLQQMTHVGQHHVLAHPTGDWEQHHIGSGAPPILSEEGWMLYYHGVKGESSPGVDAEPGGMVYRSGVMLLDRDDPRRILYRSFKPVLAPQGAAEQHGIVSDVVFPTAVDVRGQRIDVYYGAADQRIAAATTHITSSVLLAPSAPPKSAIQRIALPGGKADEAHRSTHSRSAVARADDAQPTASRNGRDAEDTNELAHLAGEAASPSNTVEQTGARTDQPPRTYGRILVALDGSRLAERVLSSIVPIARQFGSTVTLLRAITPVKVPEPAPAGMGPVQASGPADLEARVEVVRRRVADYLQDVAIRLEHEGLTVETEGLEGPPSDVILRRARELNVDLIALTTHGRTGVDRLMLGSVAEDVIRRTGCPVHLVRVKGGN